MAKRHVPHAVAGVVAGRRHRWRHGGLTQMSAPTV